jgi:hypothetical protein
LEAALVAAGYTLDQVRSMSTKEAFHALLEARGAKFAVSEEPGRGRPS